MSPTKTQTFKPLFIKQGSEDNGIDAAAIDLSGKKWVWVKDEAKAFVKGWIVKEEGDVLHVKCLDDTDRKVNVQDVEKVNPPKFDQADDMADLTHLNEASVINNLQTRYQNDLIYTYSGLFLVAINPYHSIPIYDQNHVQLYRNKRRGDTRPHIFATSDIAYHDMMQIHENQSILVTGESGAGKTENTKKVIQYLASIASCDGGQGAPRRLEQQILQANPILEAFGNAQTVRNNNSSRFGKFIKIEFSSDGQISGANIEWYLLEKSRVVHQTNAERNYHIFYQLLRGANSELKQTLLLDGSIDDYAYLKHSNKSIAGVDDSQEFAALRKAFTIMGFSEDKQLDVMKIIAAILHIGNVEVASDRSDQARLPNLAQVEKLCHILGVPVKEFTKGLLTPRVKAGREWVVQARSASQVRFSLDALAKAMYERAFGDLVDTINQMTQSPADNSAFIGVLDIAGFEIFEVNSFEQLCINYTNEKLQQFFNHHMFVLEQEEYAREDIEWKFIDFGHDLQPTIDLIEKANPIGILSLLDEQCVMPKATDRTFTDQLNEMWKGSSKYTPGRFQHEQGFTLTHYAADVEYRTDGWLEKNKDPLNENITQLLAAAHEKHVAYLFQDSAVDTKTERSSRVKKGIFRTVAQRHKEQLTSLMNQLNSTQPHFVRCIVPNHEKKPRIFSGPLVLDQLRCNGVLEGIRIARTGFPNRLPFAEFRQRYEVLTPGLPKGFIDGRKAAQLMLEKLDIDEASFRIGLTKVFFRAGVLAQLEELRDALLQDIMSRFQAASRGYMVRRMTRKRLYRQDATKLIQRNMMIYLELQQSPWWQLHMKMKPLLNATRTDEALKKKEAALAELESRVREEENQRRVLEEQRRSAETERKRIEELLQKERALMLDKEELYKRAQNRLSDLEEQLVEEQRDGEVMEEQIEELINQKKEIENKLESYKARWDEARALIMKLESEKSELIEKVQSLETSIAELQSVEEKQNSESAKIQSEITYLQSLLKRKVREVDDAKSRYEQSLSDLQARVSDLTGKHSAATQKARNLESENKEIQEQLANLSTTATGYESIVRQKEADLAIMRQDLQKSKAETESSSRDRDAVKAQIADMIAELEKLRGEVKNHNLLKAKLEEEATRAKVQLEAKNSTEAELSEKSKLIDTELAELKGHLASLHDELTDERKAKAELLTKHATELKELEGRYQAALADKNAVQEQLKVEKVALSEARTLQLQADKKRAVALEELKQVQARLTEVERSRSALEASQMKHQRLVSEATGQKNALQAELDDLLDERSTLTSEINALRAEVEKYQEDVSNIDLIKKRANDEITVLKERLAAEQNARRNSEKEQSAKASEAAKTASRENADVIASLKQQKASVDTEMKRLQQKNADLSETMRKLDQQRQNVTLEIEDLTVQLNRERQTAREGEKKVSTLEKQVAEMNAIIEEQRQHRELSLANIQELQAALDLAKADLNDKTNDLLEIRQSLPVSQESASTTRTKNTSTKVAEMTRKLEEAQAAVQHAEQRRLAAAQQLADNRKRFGDELRNQDKQYSASRQALLSELANASGRSNKKSPAKPMVSYPGHAIDRTAKGLFSRDGDSRGQMRVEFDALQDSSERSKQAYEDAALRFNRRLQDLEGNIESLEARLDLSDVQKRELEKHLATLPKEGDGAIVVSAIRRLELENARLHEILDESAKSSASEDKDSSVLNVRDLHNKSMEELQETFTALAKSREAFAAAQRKTAAELKRAHDEVRALQAARDGLQTSLANVRSEQTEVSQHDAVDRQAVLRELNELALRLENEESRNSELSADLDRHKKRADDFFGRLEEADSTVRKAIKSEAFAKEQWHNAEEALNTVQAERKLAEDATVDLQKQVRELEARIEDGAAESFDVQLVRQRLEQEIEDHRRVHTQELEDRDRQGEQTKKKYQRELSTLAGELESERNRIVALRAENRELRTHADEIQSKWDEDVINRNSWTHEKTRVETKVAELTKSLEDTAAAHREAQGNVINLLSEIRNLRSTLDEAESERFELQKEKRNLEHRLHDATTRLDSLAEGNSSARDAALRDKELIELRASISEQKDMASTAVDRMRKAEALAAQAFKDKESEREANVQLHKDLASLDKIVKELQLRLVDYETRPSTSGSGDARSLQSRVQELEKQLQEHEKYRNEHAKTVRNTDRTVRDLQFQLSRSDKGKSQLESELSQQEKRIQNLTNDIQDLHTSENNAQLRAARAEREAREQHERCLRLERELERYKSRQETGTGLSPRRAGTLLGRSPTLRTLVEDANTQ
ncbi:class II myosin [Saitoella coloradoensis]